MGAKGVRIPSSQRELNEFTRCLLKDMQALERMLRKGWFEEDPIRIGAEQEVCLIDNHGKPAPKALEILAAMQDPLFTTEIAQFNMEINLPPVDFAGDCLSIFANKLKDALQRLLDTSVEFGAMPVLTGILPTIRKFDIEIDKLTPIDRYHALIDAINASRGGYELKIEGLDEFNIKQSSALIEACNTSFQVHLQIRPDDFVNKYNIAQAVSAPVLGVATNSPMLFGKRLWSETRIALFQQSVDTRVSGEHLRYTSPRVTFGNSWLRNSILDLYRDGIARFKVLLMTDVEEDVFKSMGDGVTPKLKALQIHNSTVYRWNRPCYGISPNGKPHLRIENRILPSGPTVDDEIANTAFWLGLMNGIEEVYPDITSVMDFDDAKSNFFKAAKSGLGVNYAWVNGRTIKDTELISKELLPIARQGLEKQQVNREDIDKYLGIIEARNESQQNGSAWLLKSYSSLRKVSGKEEASIALVAATARYQQTGKPVHEWPLASIDDIADWEPTSLLVEEFMSTDLFTITGSDIPEFCADMMDWQQLRYVPVEDEKGELVGLMNLRGLLRYFLTIVKNEHKRHKIIEEVMIKDPITIGPNATLMEAIELMRKHEIGCLPVVINRKLIGVITESDFVHISSNLLRRLSKKPRMKLLNS